MHSCDSDEIIQDKIHWGMKGMGVSIQPNSEGDCSSTNIKQV